MAELRQRVDGGHFQPARRIEFYLLICVTHGKCTHNVDFKPVNCEAGILLALRPAQANQFDAEHDWDGWLLIFRPEFLLQLGTGNSVSDMKLGIDDYWSSTERLDSILCVYLSIRSGCFDTCACRVCFGSIARVHDFRNADAICDRLHLGVHDRRVFRANPCSRTDRY